MTAFLAIFATLLQHFCNTLQYFLALLYLSLCVVLSFYYLLILIYHRFFNIFIYLYIYYLYDRFFGYFCNTLQHFATLVGFIIIVLSVLSYLSITYLFLFITAFLIYLYIHIYIAFMTAFLAIFATLCNTLQHLLALL